MRLRRRQSDPAPPKQVAVAPIDAYMRPCTGCAHSASGAPFPGHPSGERPCCFCVRNPGADPSVLHPDPDFEGETPYTERLKRYRADPDGGVWYGGTPAWKTPMDNYIATDRLQQERIFAQLDAVERGDAEVEPRQSIPGHDGQDVFCCDGGPAPGGHAWLCAGWLGWYIS